MMKQKWIRSIKSEKGSGLVLSLMVLLVLSVLGASLGVITIGSYRLADTNQDSNSAYYIAEAGANMAYEELKNEVMDAYEASETKNFFYTNKEGFKGVVDKVNGEGYSEEFATQNGKQPTAEISIEGPIGDEDEREYIITSVGKINSKTRVAEKSVAISWFPKNSDETGLDIPYLPKNAAIVFKDSLAVGTNPEVNGNVIRGSVGDIPEGFEPSEGEVIVDDSYPWDDWDNYTVDVNNYAIIPQLNKSADLTLIDTYDIDKIILLERPRFGVFLST